MKSHTFTEQEFNVFDAEVRRLVGCFGMVDWHVTCEHQQIGNRVNAQVQYNPTAKTAMFRLSQTSEGDFGWQIDPLRLAMHEVLHLLLADFVFAASKLGDDAHDIVVAREHEVINRLMRIL